MLEAWRLQEALLTGETIIQKLVLPAGSQDEIAKFLSEKNVDDRLIYPDKVTSGGDAREV